MVFYPSFRSHSMIHTILHEYKIGKETLRIAFALTLLAYKTAVFCGHRAFWVKFRLISRPLQMSASESDPDAPFKKLKT
jgi:hypothetical protein